MTVRHSDDPVAALAGGGHNAAVGAPGSFVAERVADTDVGLTDIGALPEDFQEKRALWGEARTRLALLTTRQREVVTLLAEGLSSKEIGRHLGISPRTVEVHRGKAFMKLEVRTSVDAARTVIHAALAEEFGA